MVYGASPMVAAAANDHYGSMNRSIYKAAFGIDVGKAVHGYGHYQQASAYPPANPMYPAPSVANPLDSAAAAAAVAAASNLTSHSHHHHAPNHYGHVDSHHQAGPNNHHAPTGSYYNYYGYYGNKFI